jgi:hypothetical protein
MTVRELLDLASPADAAAFDAQWLGYTQTFGAPVLRAEIAGTYDHGARKRAVLCRCGRSIYVANHACSGRATTPS